MKKNNIFLTSIVCALFSGCTTLQEPQYREGEPKEDFAYPSHKEIERSFYLLGDGGYSVPGGSSEGLLAFKTYVDSVKQVGNYTLFLGDNIYPEGLEAKDHPNRVKSEYRLDAQIDAVENYDGKILFMPGNHDWYNQGLVGLKRQEDYLQKKLERDDVFSPKAGCALQSIDISEDIQLLVVDSQWYLEDWDENPKINDNCPEIKTREAMFLEVESELKKNQNKTVVFAIHHPLYTNGLHGGNFHFNNHLYPTQRKVPLPILGSLITLIRTTGGVSSADTQNERYKYLRQRLETIAGKWGNVVFVSGHDHSLQYIEEDYIKQIVSGSASKASYVGLRDNGLFAYPGQGFAVLDVFKDGSSWVSFYGSENKTPKLLYQKEIIQRPEVFKTDTLPTHFPETVKASVYEPEKNTKSDFYKSIWGDRYRELYSTEIEVKVADLDTLYGGLEPMRKGGGHQTNSIRVKDSLDREYNFRMIKKDAVQFLQSVAFKNKPISEQFENTLAEEVIEDFYTSSHPFAFLTIPTLSDAIGVLHTNPELYFLPKQPELGTYNAEHGEEIYMIEERPEENWLNYESFGSPNHDIQSTSGMFERLRRDEKYTLNEASYVKARIFDMLIGDWDRHNDQWRWAEIEEEDGNRAFEPIPRDRDQVFSNFDGALFGSLRGLLGFANQFAVYGEDIKDIKWFNTAAIGLDRSLLQNVGKDTWLEQAKFVQENITDEVIEEAFAELPNEVQGEITQNLIQKLKGRRDNIVDISMRYYNHLASLAIVTGTDKDDFIDVTRIEDGSTKVKITRNKGGERDDVLSEKIYFPGETEEIWIYGLDDDDEFYVEGPARGKILVRIIGGQNNDIYHIENGSRVKVYDHKSQPNTVAKNEGADIKFTDDYQINVYDKDRKIFTSSSMLPSVGFNPDDGIILGLRNTYMINGFERNPFTARHRVTAGYFFATQGFEIGYEGEFANVVGNYNFGVGAYYSSPKTTRNFFGYGNETFNPDDVKTLDYNRSRISEIKAEAGIIKETPFGRTYRFMATFEGNKVEDTEGRFLIEEFTTDPDFYERKYFAGLEGIFHYESYDDVLNPTNGMNFKITGGGKMNVEESGNSFAYLNPYMEFYNSISRNRKWVLNTKVQAEINFGDDFEFYQAATLGGNNGLRGYRHERFVGGEAFAAGGDIRYSFDKFKTRFLPFQIGLFGGYDIGRVWLDGENSNVWHDSYGGGFWINSAEAVSGKFNFFTGSEGWRFSFGFGFSF